MFQTETCNELRPVTESELESVEGGGLFMLAYAHVTVPAVILMGAATALAQALT